MLQRLKTAFFSLALIIGLGITVAQSACCHVTSQDAIVFQTEMDFMAQAAIQPAESLTFFIKQYCPCTEGKFLTEECKVAAGRVVLIQSRIPWHKAMALYLAGVSKERPAKEPPVVPAPESLCPNVEGNHE